MVTMMKINSLLRQSFLFVLVVALIILEALNPGNSLTALSIWIARAIIITCAVHKAIIFLSLHSRDLLEALAGFGGLLYLIGVHLWTVDNGASAGATDMDLLLRTVGIALLLLPKLWKTTEKILAHDLKHT